MSKFRVCLDAGHFGKYNISPVNKNYVESNMAWELHLLLKKYLERHGIEVIQTRADKDTDKGLYARGKTAKGCDLFISLHSNACNTESVDHPVIIVPISGKGDAIGKKLADCVTKVMGTRQTGMIYKKKGSGDWDYYSVIAGAVSVGVIGIIIEHSFHTNLNATKWLLNKSNLDKLAKAEADIIAEYFGIKVKKEEPKEQPKKTVEELAKEVIQGKWGAGTARKKALTEAGYDYDTVQARVTELMTGAKAPAKKSVDEIAKEVIQGKWSAGAERKKKLEAAGYNYNEVQARVTELMKPAKKSVNEIAKEVIQGKWGAGTERKKKLEAAGYNYSEVQKRVNELLR